MQAVLPAIEFEFRQLKHVLDREAPTVAEYVPAPQSTQAAPPREYLPARHLTQSVDALAPMAEELPAGQFKHVLAREAPTVAEYLPAPQSTQAVPPREYLPARQFTQSVDALAPMAEELPAAQLKHVPDTVAPTVAEYLPTPQSTQAAPPREYLPARQFTQSVDALAPVAEDLPAAQLKHVLDREAPTVAEYVPAPQSTQAVPAREYLPARQLTQSVDEPAPMAEDLPAAQSVHIAGPEPALNFPAGHNTHVAPLDPDAPGLQLQFVRRADARVELEYAGHTWQVGLPASDHVPASHGLHVSTPVAPTAAEYSPPAHLEHSYRSRSLS